MKNLNNAEHTGCQCNKRYYEESCEVINSKFITESVVSVFFKSKNIADNVKPGQFINIQAGKDKSTIPVLRRPFAISDVNKKKSLFEITFQIKGKGTKILSEILIPGFKANILGPLGNGFNITPNNNKKLLIAGGLGIAPIKILLNNFLETQNDVTLIWGNKSKEDFFSLEYYLDKKSKLFISSDDGSIGFEGNALDMLKAELSNKNIKDLKFYDIYVVGPTAMMKAISSYILEKNLNCQISLESAMACGIGVCQGCAVETKDESGYKLVCKDGPVFYANEVKF